MPCPYFSALAIKYLSTTEKNEAFRVVFSPLGAEHIKLVAQNRGVWQRGEAGWRADGSLVLELTGSAASTGDTSKNWRPSPLDE